MRFLLAVIISIITTFYIVTANNTGNIVTTNYSTNEGLAHKCVTWLIQDKDGFVWAATTNGLSRFDGYTFKNFYHDNDDSTSLRGTSIWTIAEGLDDKIWLSTDAGLEYFDKKTETFHLIPIPNQEELDFSKNLCVDKNGYVWVYNTKINFIAINPKDNSIAISGLVIPKVFFDGNAVEIYTFTVIDDVIWVVSDQGIFKYYYKSGDIQFVYKTKLLYCSNIQKIDETTLLLSFLFESVCIVNITTNAVTWIPKKTFLPQSPDDALINVATHTKNTLWIGSTNGIIAYNLLDTQSPKTYVFQGEVISHMIRDRNDNIIFGTYNKGMYVIKQHNTPFKTFSSIYKDDPSNPIVTSLQAFPNGSVLFSNNNDFYASSKYYNVNIDNTRKIRNSSTAMIFSGTGNICYANNVDTLYEYNSETGILSKKIVSPATNCAHKDAFGILWLGSWHGMVYGYDSQYKLKYTIVINKHKNRSVYRIDSDSDGNLWVGTFGSGLVHIQNPRSQNPTIIKYVYTPGKNSISNNLILSLYNDKKGNLWIGTCGGGLNKLNLKTKQFQNFTIKDGLKSNVIESIIADNSGNIWFGSNVLTKYDVANNTFTHFTQSDGIYGNFLVNAVSKTKEGYLLFGTSQGILLVKTVAMHSNSAYTTPLITNMKVRGITVYAGKPIDGSVLLSHSITYSQSIEIPYDFNTFTFEFASIHVSESHNIVYEYIMEGIDKTWIPADTKNRIASYSALPPGTYIFRVRAGDGHGTWSAERKLKVTVIPPWWKTWWLRIGLLLCIITIVWWIIYYRFSLIKQQSQLLDNKVKERTRDLLVANKKLYATNEQLKQNQIVIEMRNADLNQALQTKDELIKILGHDFKNPLTGILGLADLLKTEKIQTNQKKVTHFAELIYKSTTTLLNQMATVLEWAQSSNKNLEANPIEINIETLVDDAISLIKENAVHKKITISKQTDFEYTVLVDPRMIGTVLRNILTNAIKYSHKGSSILIIIQEIDSTIDINVIDTGIGMNQETLSCIHSAKIIQSSPGTADEKGTGFGLHICKTFIEKNHGKLSIVSEENKGTIVTVSLPKGLQKVSSSPVNSTEASFEPIEHEKKHESTILIIDDSIEIREIIQGIFDSNYTVIQSDNGKEGLYIAQHLLPDIIISDIMLPGIDGYEICKTIKTNDVTKHIPVLLISSQIGLDTETKSFEAGANDFIQKPFNSYILQQKVLSLLELKKLLFDKMTVEHEMDKKLQLPLDYDNKIILKVLEFIEQNLHDTELDTEMVSAAIGVSRTQLWRIFKKTTDKTLGDYIRDLRLEKAAEMLKTNKYRVSEVAFEVGYSDAKYFTKNFQKKYGVSPTQFAAEQQK